MRGSEWLARKPVCGSIGGLVGLLSPRSSYVQATQCGRTASVSDGRDAGRQASERICVHSSSPDRQTDERDSRGRFPDRPLRVSSEIVPVRRCPRRPRGRFRLLRRRGGTGVEPVAAGFVPAPGIAARCFGSALCLASSAGRSFQPTISKSGIARGPNLVFSLSSRAASHAGSGHPPIPARPAPRHAVFRARRARRWRWWRSRAAPSPPGSMTTILMPCL